MKKILVIQQKMIGDVLISTILCESLANAFPNYQIDYLIYEHTYDVFSKNNIKYNVILFKNEYRNNKKELISFAKKIRNENYDIIIDAYSKLESWIIVAFSKSPIKISFSKGLISNILYTHLVERHSTPTSNLGMVIEHRLKLLSPLKIDSKNIVTKPHIFVTPEETNIARKILISNGIDLNTPIAMLNILGSGESKTYPLQYMAKVIDEVAKEDVQIIFNFLPNQKAIAEEILNLCNKETRKKIFSNIYAENLRILLAILKECKIVIGNDGGTMNMAKALNKPTFIIFSPWIEKKAWATFEDGQKHISVHLQDYLPNIINWQDTKTIKKMNSKLYLQFIPYYFKNILNNFVKNNI